MTSILKRRDFARWQASEKLPDAALCKAVQEMENGLIDADLGGSLYKKRVARPGGGKSGGYRTLLSARIGSGVMTWGIPIGFGVIIFTIVVTAIYVRRANSEFDALSDQIKQGR